MYYSAIIFKNYKQLYTSIYNIYSLNPNTQVYRDIMRIPLARQACNKHINNEMVTKEEIDAYLGLVIQPYEASELNELEFETLYNIYGEGIYKLFIIDQNLRSYLQNTKNEKNDVITSGGACAMEHVDLQYIRKLRDSSDERSNIKDYVDNAMKQMPTWSQVVGSFIPSRFSIFYDETYPWYMKIDSYGVENAITKTQELYEKIFQKVKRYSQLVDQNNYVYKLPFIELDLEKKNLLKDWFIQYEPYVRELEQKGDLEKIEYTEEDFLKKWLHYTYIGPKIKECIVDLIKKKNPDLYYKYNLSKISIHIRGKQIDHLAIERYNRWQAEIVLNKQLEFDNRLRKLLKRTHSRQETALYMWARSELSKNESVGLAGFIDANYNGFFLHEVLQKRQKGGLICGLDPLRLTEHNIEEILRILYLHTLHSDHKADSLLSYYQVIMELIQEQKDKLQKLTITKCTTDLLKILIKLSENKTELILENDVSIDHIFIDICSNLNKYKLSREFFEIINKSQTIPHNLSWPQIIERVFCPEQ